MVKSMGAKRDKTSVNVPLQGGMCMPYEQPLRWNKSEPREVNSAGSQKFMLRESLPVTRADGIAARKPKDRIS